VTAPVAPIVQPVLAPITDVAEPVLKPVVEAVDPIVGPVADGVQSIVAPVESVIEPVTAPVADVLQPTLVPVRDVVQPALVPIEYLTQPVTAPVWDVVQPAPVLIGEVVQPVLEPVTEPMGDVPVIQPATAPAKDAAPIIEWRDNWYDAHARHQERSYRQRGLHLGSGRGHRGLQLGWGRGHRGPHQDDERGQHARERGRLARLLRQPVIRPVSQRAAQPTSIVQSLAERIPLIQSVTELLTVRVEREARSMTQQAGDVVRSVAKRLRGIAAGADPALEWVRRAQSQIPSLSNQAGRGPGPVQATADPVRMPVGINAVFSTPVQAIGRGLSRPSVTLTSPLQPATQLGTPRADLGTPRAELETPLTEPRPVAATTAPLTVGPASGTNSGPVDPRAPPAQAPPILPPFSPFSGLGSGSSPPTSTVSGAGQAGSAAALLALLTALLPVAWRLMRRRSSTIPTGISHSVSLPPG
jgi:hypothetical protein